MNAAGARESTVREECESSLTFTLGVSAVETVSCVACTEGSRQLLTRSRGSLTLRAMVHVTACQSVPFLWLVRRLNIVRALFVLLALAAACPAATPDAIVSARQYTSGEPRSCEITIVAVDGRRLTSPQQQVRVRPGRHVLTVEVRFLWRYPGAKPKVEVADASVLEEFEAARYTIEGSLSPSGKLRLRVENEDRKRELSSRERKRKS